MNRTNTINTQARRRHWVWCSAQHHRRVEAGHKPVTVRQHSTNNQTDADGCHRMGTERCQLSTDGGKGKRNEVASGTAGLYGATSQRRRTNDEANRAAHPAAPVDRHIPGASIEPHPSPYFFPECEQK